MNPFQNSNIKQTIVVCDGLTYGNNAGTIVRQCTIFGCDAIIFCPLDETRLNKIELDLNDKIIKNIGDKYQNNFHIYQLKNIYRDINNRIRYTKNFKKLVKKFSMNHCAHIKIFYDIPINKIIEEALKNNFQIFRLENKNKIKSIFSTDLSFNKVMLIVGNESEGICDYIMENKNIQDLYIPSNINLDSLNVASSATIACFERFRQFSQIRL